MKKKELLKRYLLFIISLFFSGVGVAFTKHGGLGVSPISSVPNILNIRFESVSMGNWLIMWNCLLILGQILILRRRFQPIQLLQVPLSFLFGYFTDFGTWIVSGIPADRYIVKILMVVLGVIILGFGISLSVIANVIMNSGEAFVKVLSDGMKTNFGNAKIAFDIGNVLLAAIMSVVFFGFPIQGLREGTLIAAVGTGTVVNWFTKRISKSVEKILVE